ncbi:MAG: hypothetical protein BGO76_02200 [Caedibacter sp. 38-128]|nr:DUF3576 domain-containing protein [Holosporales bacterium]OJX08550.1 MAG: hypothetical protein BGO76_02200 [Caedibacter sp. 38-128]
MFRKSSLIVLSGAIFLNACEGMKVSNDDEIKTRREQKYRDMDKAFGDDAFTLGGDRDSGNKGEIGVGVNSFLWRASLDTISFIPLKSADPFGGVILTEWYTPSAMSTERIKVDILIIDRQLRADGIKVSVFRQKRQGTEWVDQPVDTQTAIQLENVILTRARQLRIDSGK